MRSKSRDGASSPLSGSAAPFPEITTKYSTDGELDVVPELEDTALKRKLGKISAARMKKSSITIGDRRDPMSTTITMIRDVDDDEELEESTTITRHVELTGFERDMFVPSRQVSRIDANEEGAGQQTNTDDNGGFDGGFTLANFLNGTMDNNNNNTARFIEVKDTTLGADMCELAVLKAAKKLFSDEKMIVVKSVMAGMFLSLASGFALVAKSQGWTDPGASLLFPVGFVMLNVSGMDLATGNMGLMSLLWLARRNKKGSTVTVIRILRNWTVTYFGNMVGSVLMAYFYWVSFSHFNMVERDKLSQFERDLIHTVHSVARNKSKGYLETGPWLGWLVAFHKGMLGNWMVTTAVLFTVSSRSLFGKICAMFIPVVAFFGQSFEHVIVSYFILPLAVMFGNDKDAINLYHIFWGNLIPCTLGNICGAFLFTALPFYHIYLRPSKSKSKHLS